jgi:TRAP transporter TAXI family solute receptor
MLKDHAGLGSTVEPVGGSTPNIHALNTNRVDVAITNAMASFNAYQAKGRFKKPVDVGILVVGNPSLRQLVIRKGSGITKVEDIKGRVFIGRRPALPEIQLITNALFKVYNVDPKSLRVIPTTETNEAMDALAAGTVDAGIIPGSAGAGYFQKASREGKIEFFPIPEDKMQAMLKMLPPAFDLETVPAGTYAGQTKPYIAFDMSTTFVASTKHLSEENGYKLVKTLFDHFDQFKTYHSAAKYWTIDRTLKQAKIPFHPGAVRYFKEKNRWTADLEKRQAALAKR